LGAEKEIEMKDDYQLGTVGEIKKIFFVIKCQSGACNKARLQCLGFTYHLNWDCQTGRFEAARDK